MPKQLYDIRDFVRLLKRGDPKHVTIHKKNVKTASGSTRLITKFKIRASKYLYTLVVDNKDKAEKLQTSLPRNVIRLVDKKSQSQSKAGASKRSA